ncbi:unnamed protein product [Arabis nemorensis]|uniref:Uncharacterized protein n=1 Tax=Arabis nemorensis TaxID=586526 RepID=A0A565C291_9BRAS|nr:unnamed protein product [Arabis nemorensis]
MNICGLPLRKYSSILQEHQSALEECNNVKGEIKGCEIWNVYNTAPRIPQKPVRPADEYGALIYAGRWEIHRVTFSPGNIGFATFGAPWRRKSLAITHGN